MGSNPGTLAEAAKNFLVGAAAPLRGRRFLNFCYGGVEGGPSVPAPVPIGFGIHEMPDFLENPECHSLPTSDLSAVPPCYSKACACTASHGPLQCCAVF